MSVATAAITKKARLAIGATSPAGTHLSFKRFNHGCTVEQTDFGREVSIGTLTNMKERVVQNRRMVRPRLELEPSVAQWQALLPMIFYNAGTGSGPVAYALGESPVTRYLAFDDTARKWELSGVAVSKATIRGRSGQAVTLELELLGIDFTNPGSYTFPALTSGPPLIFKTSAATIGATALAFDDFTLSVDWGCDPDRFFNSETLAGVVPLARTVAMSATLPWGQHQALWDAGAGVSGCAVAVTLAGVGGASLAFAMPAVKSQQNPYDAQVPQEVKYQWDGMVLGSAAANDELTATLTLPS